jgi:hypothetical protein
LLDSSGDIRFEIKSTDNSKYIRLDSDGNLDFELGELNVTATKLNINAWSDTTGGILL